MENNKENTNNSGTLLLSDVLKEKRRLKKVIIINWISAVVILVIIVWGVIIYFHLDNNAFTNDAQVESYVNPIDTRIAGYIKEIHFSEHQHIRKGDTLIIIDDSEYKITLKIAEATLLDAQANRNATLSGQEIAQNTISVSDDNLSEIKARLVNAETNYIRFKNLVKDDAATEFQLDQYQSERDAILAKYKSLEHLRFTSKLTTHEIKHRVSASDANIKKAEAEVEQAKLNLSYAVITAPYDCFAGRKTIEEGQYVSPGQNMISIVRNNDKWITANYTESQLRLLKIGRMVSIKIDAFPEKIYYGSISALSAASGSRYSAIPVDNANGNFVKVEQRFPVRIDFNSKNAKGDIDLLKAGMNAEIESIK